MWTERLAQILTVATPILVPALVGWIKGAVRVPSWLRPALAIGLGAAIDLLNTYVLGSGVGLPMGALLGALGIVTREILVALKAWVAEMEDSK